MQFERDKRSVEFHLTFLSSRVSASSQNHGVLPCLFLLMTGLMIWRK